MYDLVIVGAGPAGLACAIEAEKRKLSYIVLEEDVIAAAIRSYDILHTLIGDSQSKRVHESPANIPLAEGLRFGKEQCTNLSAMLETWNRDIDRYGIREKIKTGQTVESVVKHSAFETDTQDTKFLSLNVVLAVGRSGNPRWLDIPGEDDKRVFHEYIDTATFGVKEIIDRDVLIVGGGDTAAEAALILGKKNRITISYRQEKFFRLNPENLDDMTEMEKTGNLETVFSSTLVKIDPGKKLHAVLGQRGAKREKDFDYIFILIGTHPPAKFFDSVGVLQEEKVSEHIRDGKKVYDKDVLPVVGINGTYGTNIPGLFVIGDALGRQKVIYNTDGGPAELQRSLFIRFAIKDGQEVINELIL